MEIPQAKAEDFHEGHGARLSRLVDLSAGGEIARYAGNSISTRVPSP